ncbi:hypothetical protein GCM10027422_16320 [Hymenobacter arcticus]
MEKIHWSIEALKPGETGVLDLCISDTQDPDAPWQFYFTGIPVSKYPAVIEAASQEISLNGEYTGVNFASGQDELEKQEAPLPHTAVEVYHQYLGGTVMLRIDFYTLLQAFAERLLTRPGQPAAWYEAMRAALAKLQAKMTADANSA